ARRCCTALGTSFVARPERRGVYQALRRIPTLSVYCIPFGLVVYPWGRNFYFPVMQEGNPTQRTRQAWAACSAPAGTRPAAPTGGAHAHHAVVQTTVVLRATGFD